MVHLRLQWYVTFLRVFHFVLAQSTSNSMPSFTSSPFTNLAMVSFAWYSFTFKHWCAFLKFCHDLKSTYIPVQFLFPCVLLVCTSKSVAHLQHHHRLTSRARHLSFWEQGSCEYRMTRRDYDSERLSWYRLTGLTWLSNTSTSHSWGFSSFWP